MAYVVCLVYKRRDGKPFQSGKYTNSQYVGRYPTQVGAGRAGSRALKKLGQEFTDCVARIYNDDGVAQS